MNFTKSENGEEYQLYINKSNFVDENDLKYNLNNDQSYKVENIEILLNEDEKKNLDKGNLFFTFKKFLYEQMSKKKYKAVVNQIELNSINYNGINETEELKYIKIEAYLKIIIHKINKYFIKTKMTTPLKSKITFGRRSSTKFTQRNTKSSGSINFSTKFYISIETYYTKINKEMNDLIDELNSISENNKIIFIEKIIQLYIKLCLVKEYHMVVLNQLPINNYYLSLCEKIIDEFFDYMTDSATLQIAEKVFIKISKQLINNRDFYNTENYCYKIIRCCIKECFLIYKDDHDDLKNNIPFKRKEKVILNLCTALLYLGICKENKGKIQKALKYYSLIEVIIKKLILTNDNEDYDSYQKYYEMIVLCKKRNEEYYELINYLTQQNLIIVNQKIEEEKKIEETMKLKEEMKNQKNYLFSAEKMKKIEEKLNKLVIPKEINLDKYFRVSNNKTFHKSSSDKNIGYKNYILSNLRLLDDYSSEDFKEAINSMEKIKIIDLDYQTKEKIEKILAKQSNNHLLDYYYKKNLPINYYQKECKPFLRKSIRLKKSMPHFQLRKNNSNNKLYFGTENLTQLNRINSSNYINNNNYTNNNLYFNYCNYNNNIKKYNKNNNVNSCASQNVVFKKISSCPNLIKDNKNRNENSKERNLMNKRNKNRIERYKIRKKTFEYSYSFKKKQKYINDLRDRETGFLKTLLKIKSEEKTLDEEFDIFKIKREVEGKFNIIKKNILFSEENIKEHLKIILNEKMINDNKKKLDKKKNILGSLSETHLFNSYKNIDKKNKKEINHEDINKTNELNKQMIDYINLDIEDINKEKKFIENEIKEIKNYSRNRVNKKNN